jgi:hypothetical protein
MDVLWDMRSVCGEAEEKSDGLMLLTPQTILSVRAEKKAGDVGRIFWRQ